MHIRWVSTYLLSRHTYLHNMYLYMVKAIRIPGLCVYTSERLIIVNNTSIYISKRVVVTDANFVYTFKKPFKVGLTGNNV